MVNVMPLVCIHVSELLPPVWQGRIAVAPLNLSMCKLPDIGWNVYLLIPILSTASRHDRCHLHSLTTCDADHSFSSSGLVTSVSSRPCFESRTHSVQGRHSGDDAIPASFCSDGVNAVLQRKKQTQHSFLLVCVEHNVVQSNFVALIVHGSIASVGACS